MGSLILIAFVAVLAFPLGIGAAIYLEEYAPDTRLTRFIDTNIRNLAGVPSIVYGILGFTIFVALRATPSRGRGRGRAGATSPAGSPWPPWCCPS